jgi:hypothetical protein
LTVTAGGILFNGGNNGLTAGQDAGSRYSALTLQSGTRAVLVADATIGSLAGSGTVTNTSTTTRTLNVGFDNTNTTFSGSIARFTDFQTNPFQVNKIGAGTLTLTGVSTAISTFLDAGGGVTFSGAGTGVFSNYFIYSGANLALDNTVASGGNLNNRLGGTLSSGTLTLAGGEFKILGSSAAPTTETIQTYVIATGGSTVTLAADPAQSLTFNLGATSAGYTTGATVLFRGLSDTIGAGNANLLKSTTGLNYNATGQSAAFISAASTANPIRPDFVGDPSATGTGQGFVTEDTTTGFYFTAATANTALGSAATSTNYGINTNQQVTGNVIANSLVLQSGGGVTNASAAAFGQFNSAATLQSLTLNQFGLLAQAGNAGISVGQFVSANSQYYVYSTGTSATSLSLAGSMTSAQGFVKGGAGSVALNSVEYNAGQTTVNQGLLTLNSGSANTLYVVPTATIPTVQPLQLNGGTLDLNGQSQMVGTLSNNSSGTNTANTGGMVTNNASGTPVNFTTSTGASVFGGVIAGNLNFIKTGNAALTLTSANSFAVEHRPVGSEPRRQPQPDPHSRRHPDQYVGRDAQLDQRRLRGCQRDLQYRQPRRWL